MKRRRLWQPVIGETHIDVSSLSLTSLSSPQGEMGPKGESGLAGHRGPTGRPGKRGKQVRASGFTPTEIAPRGLEMHGAACRNQLEPSQALDPGILRAGGQNNSLLTDLQASPSQQGSRLLALLKVRSDSVPSSPGS